MSDHEKGEWGPWIEFHGGGMPVPSGTVVEVWTATKPTDGVYQKVGIAGVDLVKSWNWTPENRKYFRSAPIDLYRVKKPKGLAILEAVLLEIDALEEV